MRIRVHSHPTQRRIIPTVRRSAIAETRIFHTRKPTRVSLPSSPVLARRYTIKVHYNVRKQEDSLKRLRSEFIDELRLGNLDRALKAAKLALMAGTPFELSYMNSLLHKAVNTGDEQMIDEILRLIMRSKKPFNGDTYALLITHRSKTNQLNKIDHLWRKLKTAENPIINDRTTQAMVQHIRAHNLGNEYIEDVWQVIDSLKIDINHTYVEFFRLYQKRKLFVEFLMLFDRFLKDLELHPYKDNRLVWLMTLYVAPRTGSASLICS